MSDGAIRNNEYAASSTTINVDWLNPNKAAFKLIDVVLVFDTAPTTSEDITIKTITAGGVTITEDAWDPTEDTDTTQGTLFDKIFEGGTTVAVDYANTDTNAITVVIRYQELARS